MKKLLTICAAVVLILAFNSPARAEWHIFEYSEEDLWNHTPSANTRLYDQYAPRRHHIAWKADVQTTDSAQGNVSPYLGIGGTSGWIQTATYDTWLSGGPLDNLENPFGISQVQLWGAGWGNSRLAWLYATPNDEKFRDKVRALEHAKKAAELSKEKDAEILDTLAKAYFINGKLKEAVEAERKALNLAPDNEAFKETMRL